MVGALTNMLVNGVCARCINSNNVVFCYLNNRKEPITFLSIQVIQYHFLKIFGNYNIIIEKLEQKNDMNPLQLL